MKDWTDSKYYERLDKVFEEDGDMKEAAMKSLEFLEDELAHPEIYGTWLVGHFNSTAEWLVGNVEVEPMKADDFWFSVGIAHEEIRLYKKYVEYPGSLIEWMENWLDRAIEQFKATA